MTFQCASVFPLMPGLFSSLLISFYFILFSGLFLSVSFYDFFSFLLLLFFVASIFLCLIFSAYVCHVTTAGSLGDQLKCDNQSINQSINQSSLQNRDGARRVFVGPSSHENHQARSAVECSARRLKGELHPAKIVRPEAY